MYFYIIAERRAWTNWGLKMKEYVYFCKNCRRLEADTADNRPFRCEECGGKFQPLHVTVPEWKTASSEERNEIVNRSVRKDVSRSNANKKKNTKKDVISAGSQDEAMDKIKAFIEKISVGEEGKNSKLSIAAFIMSFLPFFSVFGLAAGIIDLLKKDGRKKGFSIATICISAIMLIGSIGAAGAPKDTATDGIVAEVNTEETAQEPILDDNLVVDTANITDTTNIVSEVEDNSSDLIDIGEDTEIAIAENTEETEPEITTRTLYTTSKVNIREQPNTDCAVLGKAENGQEVIEYEAGVDGWSRVACGGVEGYIKSEFLTQEAPNTATTQEVEPTASVAATEPVQNTPVPAQEATAVVASVPETTGTMATSVVNNSSASSGGGGASVTIPAPETGDNLVWIPTNGGTKYHRNSSCSKMIDPIQVTLDTAKANGFDACGRCY